MQLRIEVGAATNASFNAVFRQLPEAAAAAHRKMGADDRAAAAMHAALLKNKWAQEKSILDAEVSETSKVNDHVRQLSAMRTKQQLRDREAGAKAERAAAVSSAEATARDLERIQEQSNKKELMLLRQSLRDKERAERTAAGGGGGRRDMAYRMGYWASRNLSPVTPMLSFAGRMAGELVRGTGVDFNVGSMAQKHIGLQSAYQDLSNQGYQEHGKGAAAIRQDPGALQREGMDLAKKYGFDPDKIVEASTAFVNLTGNLEGARNAMGGLARLSNATHSDLTNMATAAASVQVQLDRAMGDDTQGKATALQNIMRQFAGQGKLGAVEIKDFASQMAKVAVVTNKFAGDRQQIFGLVGALAQESRKAGGSASASQAATSVARFASMMTTGKTSANFAKLGIDVFANKEKTLLRNPEEIIMEALSHTKGSIPAMSGLFKNVMGGRAVEGFANIYNNTKGTNQEKLAAVKAEFDELMKATMSAKEEEDNNAKVMETAAKKAQVFQNELQEIVSVAAEKVLPALEKLEPDVLKLAAAFGTVTTWLATNPFAVIPLALTAAIAKAGIEQTIRVGVENVFKDLSGKAGPGVLGGAGVAGNIAAAFTIGMLVVTTLKVGSMLIDSAADDKSKRLNEGISAETEAGNAASVLKAHIKSGTVTQGDVDAAKKADEALEVQRNRKAGAAEKAFDFLFNPDILDKDANDKASKAEQAKNDARLQEHTELLKLIATGTLNVRVTSMPYGPPPPPVSDGASTEPSGEHD